MKEAHRPQTLARTRFTTLKIFLALSLLCVVAAAASGTTFKTLADFVTTGNYGPNYMSLAQGLDGNLYGTTFSGGANNEGTVFKTTPAGTVTTIYSFCSLANCADGEQPYDGVILGTDGNFYGTTFYGGANGCCIGTVFKITPAGKLTTLHSFGAIDGISPWGALVQGTDGNFYGTTSAGGLNSSSGTVFKISPSGEFTSLYSFCSLSNCADGKYPRGGLVQASNGLFYGVTLSGGAFGSGSVYSISSTGTLSTVFSFNDTDGYTPYGSLVEIAGDFYGTTSAGGSGCSGNGCGTVFQVTPGGTMTTLHFFDGTDGYDALGTLIEGTDGNLYGTTTLGGTNSAGTIFKISTSGTFDTLYNFCSQPQCTDNSDPYGGLTQAASGNFYGTTNNGAGTLYELSTGLHPFVKTLPGSGAVGAKVQILGYNLAGATSVTFNGTAAEFTAKSTSIVTHVPTGATSGTVEVTVGANRLKSNVAFRVVP
jgi:uncharacterized repeat protein (TIGR03803 family)